MRQRPYGDRIDRGRGQISDVATLIYDGSCGFCRKWVMRAKRLKRRKKVNFLPLQAEDAEAITGRSRDELSVAVHFVTADGRVFTGAAAVREFIKDVRGGGIVVAASRVPGVMLVAEWVYRWVARRWGPLGFERSSR